MIGGILALGRKLTLQRMSETVEVGVIVERTDPDTGNPVRTLSVEHYAGVGEIKYPTQHVSENATQVGQQQAEASPLLKVPADGSGAAIRAGDGVHVLASKVDGTLVGRWYRVRALPQSGHVTAHRFPLEEVT
ncbi:MAG: hypothetical protein D3X82_16870 [Candidatus Leucobacter sulfamidivorax]|nr:hypothetical protein [Candidatus Leucobacter sulfamidivorax]